MPFRVYSAHRVNRSCQLQCLDHAQNHRFADLAIAAGKSASAQVSPPYRCVVTIALVRGRVFVSWPLRRSPVQAYYDTAVRVPVEMSFTLSMVAAALSGRLHVRFTLQAVACRIEFLVHSRGRALDSSFTLQAVARSIGFVVSSTSFTVWLHLCKTICLIRCLLVFALPTAATDEGSLAVGETATDACECVNTLLAEATLLCGELVVCSRVQATRRRPRHGGTEGAVPSRVRVGR